MDTKSKPLPRSPLSIRIALLRLGITLTEAAKEIGVSRSMVSQVLDSTAKSQPVIDSLRELIRVRRDSSVPLDGEKR